MVEPSPVRTRRRAGWSILVAPLLSAAAIGGMVWMSHLSDRANRLTRLACLSPDDAVRRAAHWTHGYGPFLPLATVAAAVLALVVALVALIRPGPVWSRVMSVAVLAVGVLITLPAVNFVDGFYSFPGSDISTVGDDPCGP